jgi:hypothetical protein
MHEKLWIIHERQKNDLLISERLPVTKFSWKVEVIKFIEKTLIKNRSNGLIEVPSHRVYDDDDFQFRIDLHKLEIISPSGSHEGVILQRKKNRPTKLLSTSESN